MNHCAREAGADQRRRRIGERDARVGFDQVIVAHALGHENLIRGPANDAADTHQKADQIQNRHRQETQPRRNRHQHQRKAASDVGQDDEPQFTRAIDQHAREETEQRIRQCFHRGEDAHFERACVQQQCRRQWQR